MKNYCCIIPFYQDVDAGYELLDTLDIMRCPSIWADGPFTEYHELHGGPVQSDDGLRELIEQSKNTTLLDCGVGYVQDKWNSMLSEAGRQGYEYAFLFGCDELPSGDFEESVNNIPSSPRPMIFRIWMDEKGNNEGERFQDYSGSKERVFFRPGDIEARELHWAFFDRTIKDSYPIVSDKQHVEGVSFIHDNTRRPKDRDRKMQEYQKKRVPQEYKKSIDVINQVHNHNHINIQLLKDRYPGCDIDESRRYDGTQQFKIYGSSEDRLSDYHSYVKMPFNDGSGLYITKGKIAIQLEK